MRVLLDTHAFLWFVLDDPQLSAAAGAAIEDPDSDVLVSPASFWELAIKISIGKYSLAIPFEKFWLGGIADNAFRILPIEVRHCRLLLSLPFHHKDPFDRLLVTQAIVENVPLISNDAMMDPYPIRRLW